MASEVQAAASLFGNDSAEDDPFAQLAPSSESASAEHSAHDLFANSNQPNSDFLAAIQPQTEASQQDVVNGPVQTKDYGSLGQRNGTAQASNANQYQPARAPQDYSRSYSGKADPYSPPPPSSSTLYVPATPSRAPSTPSASAFSSQYATYTPGVYSSGSQSASPYTSAYGAYASTPAPAPAAAPLPVDRPKVSNAYDPPFMPRNTRRAVSRPNIAQHAYGGEPTAVPPLPPPPPRAPSVPHYREDMYQQTSPPPPLPNSMYSPPPSSLPPPPARAPSIPPPPPRAPSIPPPHARAPSVPPPRAPSIPPPPGRSSIVRSAKNHPVPPLPTRVPSVPPPPARIPSVPPPPARAPSVQQAPSREASVAPTSSTVTPSQGYSVLNGTYSVPPSRTSSVVHGASSPDFFSQENTDVSEGREAGVDPDLLVDDYPIQDPAEFSSKGSEEYASVETLPAPGFDSHAIPLQPHNPVQTVYEPHQANDAGQADFFDDENGDVQPVESKEASTDAYAPPPASNGAYSPPLTTKAPSSSAYSPPTVNSYAPPSRASYEAPRSSVSSKPSGSYAPPPKASNTTPSSRIGSPVNGSAYDPRRSSNTSSYGLVQAYDIPMNPNSYAPGTAKGSNNVYAPRNRSTSNGSAISGTSGSAESGYGSYQPHQRTHSNETDISSGPYTSRYSNANDSTTQFQEIAVKNGSNTAYAPSPSLLGANDPLNRTSARAPVISFGFGGKIVTCFHGADSLSTGFDVALSSRNTTGVQIQSLNQVISPNVLREFVATDLPGPLYPDTGGLVRTSQNKSRKTKVLSYLAEREDEISKGINYLHSGSLAQQQQDGKLVLVQLLKIMIENDGRLSGTSTLESAVRTVLVPHMDKIDTSTSGFVSPVDVLGSAGPTVIAEPNALPVLNSTTLDKLQEFLLRGQRRQAYQYALDNKLWAHAMVISSGINKEAWHEVVNEFLRTELGSPLFPDREPLRVAYSYFSGQGSAAVKEMVPPASLQAQPPAAPLPGMYLSIPAVPMPLSTPLTPNFSAPPPSNNVPHDVLSKWKDTLAMLISSSSNADNTAVITALGDQLLANQWVEAAHACYLVSLQTSLIGGLGHPTARVVVLGAKSPQVNSAFSKELDSIILTEILEFALSLNPVSKGSEPFGGLPHLQPYRLLRAYALADIGEKEMAQKYCEAIASSMTRGSPYFTHTFLDQLKTLSDRIGGVNMEKGGSWMGGKIGKPSLDGIGGWFEGRLTKLVTGGDEATNASTDSRASIDATAAASTAGPFSQYGTISSTSPSPAPSLHNNNAWQPPPRTDSAASMYSLNNGPTERSRSAADFYQPGRGSSPVNAYRTVASANASTTTFAQSGLHNAVEQDNGQEATWWGNGNGNSNSPVETPTASMFMKVDDSAAVGEGDGFVSLMDTYTPYSAVPTPSNSSFSNKKRYSAVPEEEEEEDLGFGNSKPKPKSDANETPDAPSQPSSAAAERPDPKPIQHSQSNGSSTTGGSFFTRWFKRDGSTPGPVKASLGEETSFYYDKDLKKWVNKKAGSDEAAAPTPPPPPPSRPQTASPGFGRPPPSQATPPLRGATSAVDLNSPPKGRPPTRLRSNLVPTEAETPPGSSPAPSSNSSLGPPSAPPSRPASGARRNVRTRYVDVFQQQGS